MPVLYHGKFCQPAIKGCIDDLRANGSVMARGFMKPEGIVVYHTAARQSYKVLVEGDEIPKGVGV